MLGKEYNISHTQHGLTTAVVSTVTDFEQHYIFDLPSADMTRTRRGSLLFCSTRTFQYMRTLLCVYVWILLGGWGRGLGCRVFHVVSCLRRGHALSTCRQGA